MLQIKDIVKTYITGDLRQDALKGVSVNFRDNEFVSILGHSGSGKTTLLNIIGGLDRYTSGDLIINGVSTKQYKDADWDIYRNNKIGFVFQSYNLIPHQSVLANVEMALTLAGVSKRERRDRAKKVLKKVGLEAHMHKKPNQMSGGQMQRVAIARALINNPDILLADEPTGALDSETSIQIMELLKEIAKDKLVVMVTHNPELAEQYSTRIVKLMDGEIVSDSDPYTQCDEPTKPTKQKKISMSFFTALALSFNNLRTKKGRTILTAFAGSIGIIGIALILSLSTGFQSYIDKIQEDTLSTYPLTIQSETADMTSMMTLFTQMGTSGSSDDENTAEKVTEQQIVTQMFANIGTNDLRSFKTHLDSNMDSIGSSINSLRYEYGITPQIYCADTSQGLTKVNPGSLFSSIMGGNTMMMSGMDSGVFHEMIDNRALLDSQYDILAGRWPEKYDEMILVLSDAGSFSDYLSYSLGFRDQAVLKDMISSIMEGNEVKNIDDPMEWTYDDLMAKRYKLVLPTDTYKRNDEYGVWEDMSEDDEYMKKLIDDGIELKIVGVIAPKKGVSASALTPGVAYTGALSEYIMNSSEDSQMVKDQLADEQTDVFTGRRFDDESSDPGFDFSSMITIDKKMLSSAFGMKLSDKFFSDMMGDLAGSLGGSINLDTAPAQADFSALLGSLAKDMLKSYIAQNADASGKAVIKLSDAENIVNSYMSTPTAKSKIAALEAKYLLPEGTLAQVYRPLLVGLITQYVSSSIEVPDIPDIPDIPVSPSDPTEPTVPTEPSVPTEPTESTEPAEPSAPIEATEATTDTTATEQTQATQATEPSHQTEPSTESHEDDTLGVSGVYSSKGMGVAINARAPVAHFSEPGGFPIDIGDIDISDLSAKISLSDVEPAVTQYMGNVAVAGTSAAMAMQMTQAAARRETMAMLGTVSEQMIRKLATAFNVDPGKIAKAFKFNFDEEELTRLMTTFASPAAQRTYSGNLRKLGYADRGAPSAIYIYLVDFAGKERFIKFIDDYNADMEAKGNEEMVINYTDMTGVLMSSVKTIVDSVSYVLIAFVAVSLIVSSIMIGIITHISVMERTKEIGVLRALGASKGNISQVFNAETFIIGCCSGLVGIGVSLLTLVPINYIIGRLSGVADLKAFLPLKSAVILVIISIVITMIGGLIPAKNAAKKDPVIALRSE